MDEALEPNRSNSPDMLKSNPIAGVGRWHYVHSRSIIRYLRRARRRVLEPLVTPPTVCYPAERDSNEAFRDFRVGAMLSNPKASALEVELRRTGAGPSNRLKD